MVKNLKEILAWVSGLFASSTRESWQVILLCVIAATTFWFFNALNNTYTTRINYPIEFVFDESEVVVTEELPSKIRLDVSGGGWQLLRKTLWFNLNPIKIQLDNPTERKYILGATLQPLISEQITELNLNYILSDTIPLHIENKISKKVPVKVDSAGVSLNAWHRINSSIVTMPDSIEIEGPQSYIDSLPDYFPLVIPKEDINEDYRADVTVRPSENRSEFVNVYPENVLVTFEVTSFTREEKDVKLEILNFPSDSSLYLTDDEVIVSFHVDENNLEKIPDAKFKVAVNLKRVNLNDSTVTPIVVQHPDYVYDISIDPANIKVIYDPQDQ